MIESIGEQASEHEEFVFLSRLSESKPRENTLGDVLNSHLPSYKEVLTPMPLPTYLGSSLRMPDAENSLRSVETSSASLGKDYTWSRGHGFKHSSIKTCSAHREEGIPPIHSMESPHTTTYIGVLRGMKYLARANP
jgi:hypothetical protein